MTLEQLRYFYEVARCLNFSQAAKNLYISQPNLTKYIASLEKELNFKLFDRSTHHCQLTEEGRQFLNSTETLFFQLNTNIELAKQKAYSPYTSVFVAIAQSELPPENFLHILNRFNQESSYHYLLVEDNYKGLITKLRDHNFDLIVTSDKNVRNIPGVSHVVLRPFDMLLAVHNSNPKTESRSLTPKDCSEEFLFICIPEGKDAPSNRLEEVYWKTGLRSNVCTVYCPTDVILNVQVGSGAGIIPSTMNLSSYQDISYYRFEQWQHTEQVMAWRSDEDRPQILSFIEQVQDTAPYLQGPDVPVYGLPQDFTD